MAIAAKYANKNLVTKVWRLPQPSPVKAYATGDITSNNFHLYSYSVDMSALPQDCLDFINSKPFAECRVGLSDGQNVQNAPALKYLLNGATEIVAQSFKPMDAAPTIIANDKSNAATATALDLVYVMLTYIDDTATL